MTQQSKSFPLAQIGKVAPTGHPIIDTLSRAMRAGLRSASQEDSDSVSRITQRALAERGLVSDAAGKMQLTELGRRTLEDLRSFDQASGPAAQIRVQSRK